MQRMFSKFYFKSLICSHYYGHTDFSATVLFLALLKLTLTLGRCLPPVLFWLFTHLHKCKLDDTQRLRVRGKFKICLHGIGVEKGSRDLGTSLAVQWLILCTSTAGVSGLIPGQGTKIPLAARPKNKGGGCRDLKGIYYIKIKINKKRKYSTEISRVKICRLISV